jgi:AcrR family transcriptional regulator
VPGADYTTDHTTDHEPGRARRASPLPPDERRAAIASATLPLLLERGLAVTTRQIAEAAGIAEGTIFRAFPDKDAVVQAAVDLAFDPSTSERALAAIDPDLPFEDQLARAVAIGQHRLATIWRLVTIVGQERNGPPPRPPVSPGVTALFARHPGRVRLAPAAAARQLWALTLALSHPALAEDPLPPREVVSLLLDGIRARTAAGGSPAATIAAARRAHGNRPC